MKTESVRIYKKVLDRLREVCRATGVSITWFVSKAIEEKLDRGN